MTITIFRGPRALGYARDWAGQRTVRTPHHTASSAAIRGRLTVDDDGLTYTPGEVGLAGNCGVLILDDLPEFRREVVEAIGHAIHEGDVVFHARRGDEAVRLRVRVRFDVVVTAATCPCGFFGDGPGKCSCSKGARERFERRIADFLEVLS